MKRQKPPRPFLLRVQPEGKIPMTYKREAPTFFEARAVLALRLGIEPGDIRLDPPRRYEP